MTSYSDRLLRRAREWRYLRQVAGVLDTPPIVAREDGLVIFSMIGTRVLLPYLVAVKSLHAQLQHGRVVILDDGTLTDSDRAALRHHCDDPQILSGPDVDTKGCPTYSSWRRLFALLEVRRENYVIQLDSDTVTIGAVPEVAECVARGDSFILKGEAGVDFAPPAEVAEQARANPHVGDPGVHVQLAMEAQMDRVRLPGVDRLRYVRGCAGFAGFALDPGGTALAEAFSAEATRLIGFDKWSEWGSEQVTSNVLIANSPNPRLLPYDRYCNFWNEGVGGDMRFVHFIGTWRFHGGMYGRLSRRVIAQLGRDPVEQAA